MGFVLDEAALFSFLVRLLLFSDGPMDSDQDDRNSFFKFYQPLLMLYSIII